MSESPALEFDFEGLDPTNFETYIYLAFKRGSSDVHFEPQPNEMRIRCRIEGNLHEMKRLRHQPGPSKPHPLTIQMKARSGMQLQSRVPEDGRIDMWVGDEPLSLRLSSMPQVFGEKIVARIFNINRITNLKSLGFRDVNLKRIRDIIGRKAGMVLISGPTGSGKTTTIYSIINYLNDKTKNVVTVEDPVEYFFPGMNQIQVELGGITFESAIRSILRQDPDIIMIGEIRDRQTAEIAFHAAMTGHLVLSTVHARDSFGSLMRLLDLGIPQVVVAQAINGIISQRLLHRLCPHCAVAAVHSPLEDVPTHEPVGCDKCSRGFYDRIGVQEVLVLNDTLRKMVSLDFSEEEFALMALSEGMETLKEDAIMKSIEGSVSYRDALGITDEHLARILNDIRRVVASLS